LEATASRRTPAARPAFLDQALDLSRVNWEVVAFAVLLVVTIGTRLWDLNSRAMHHDESIHAYYSYQQFLGNPAAHARTADQPFAGYDPAYHGPFLYNIVALSYFLFGATEATSRLMPAIFGIILLGLCWLLRPYLGRVGALTAALFVALSPSIMYYSRSLRHDIFALVGTMMLFLAILGYMRSHRSHWIILGALGFGIAYTSHELVFLNVFIFATFLIVAWLVLNFLGAPGDRDRNMQLNPITEGLRALFTTGRWALLGGIGLFVVMYLVLFSNLMTTPQGIIDGIAKGIAYWGGQHGVARGNQPVYYYALLLLPIYELLAYITAFVTLIFLGVRLALGKADVPSDLPADAYPETAGRQRGSFFTEGTDEAGYGLPSAALMHGFTVAFLAWWSFGALVAYSLAGEKMPWLTMQMALPFSLLAAAGIGRLVQRIAWKELLDRGGLFMGILLLLIIFAVLAFFVNLPGVFNNPSPQLGQQAQMRALVLAAFILLMVGAVAWLWLRLTTHNAWRVIALTLVFIGLVYGIRSAWLANYRNGDVPVEMLVYTQTAPDVPLISKRIERLSRDLTAFTERNTSDVTGGRSLQIGIDTTVEWPFDWYFRDQRKLARFATHDQNGAVMSLSAAQTAGLPASAPVLLVSDDFQAQSDFQGFIADKYTGTRYKLRWWFPEDETTYKIPARDAQGNPVFEGPPGAQQQVWDNLGFLGTYFGTLFTPFGQINGAPSWQRPVKYLLYRDPGAPLGSTDVWLYVRNDLLTRAGSVLGDLEAAAGGTDPGTGEPTTPTDPGVTFGMLDLPPEGDGNGQFNKPRGMAQGPDGSFYVVDTGNLRVQKFDKDGKFLLTFGEAGTADGQFQALTLDTGPAAGTGPGGIAVDSQGAVYVADTWNHRIQKFDANGRFVRQWGGYINLGDAAADQARASTSFFGPRGLAVDAQNNLYVTDTGNRRVVMYDNTGRFLRQFGEGLKPDLVSVPNNGPNQLNEPIGVAVDRDGNVYVADVNNRRIVKFGRDGQPITNWPVDAFAPGAFNEPFMDVGSDNNLYVSDPTGQRVLKYDGAGQLLGSKNAEGTTTLSRPTGIVVAADNAIYIADTDKPGVIKLTSVP
jgi:uncharacterized protein (TIGR03663 family)